VHNPLPVDRAHLNGLIVFLAVAELRGFRGAARHLGIAPSAVSQTIRALEERVGAPLLCRTTRSVGLTQAGEHLLNHTRPAIEMLSAGIAEAAKLGSAVSGKLRITSPRPTLPMLANRLFPDFFSAYPNVQLELYGEDGLEGPLILNDVEMIIRAALRGVGLAWLPSSLVFGYLASGEMETVLDEFRFEEDGLMLFYPSRAQSARVKVVVASFMQPVAACFPLLPSSVRRRPSHARG